MKFLFEPAKNQKFEIGRTISFAKCDCEKCDFMHCPKNNYAVKMVRKKYTVKEFFGENKDAIIKAGCIRVFFNNDTLSDFIDACISFPRGTYWRFDYEEIELVTQNRSKYGEDFLTRASIALHTTFPIRYFVGCSGVQEKLAEKIQKSLFELDNLLLEEICNEQRRND